MGGLESLLCTDELVLFIAAHKYLNLIHLIYYVFYNQCRKFYIQKRIMYVIKDHLENILKYLTIIKNLVLILFD